MTRPLFVQGMKGLGDNIYQRPFIRAATEKGRVWLETPWPEFYDDLDGLEFVKDDTHLRAQRKNVVRQNGRRWASPPPTATQVRVHYGSRALKSGSIVQAMEKALPLGSTSFRMDLPALPDPPLASSLPIAVIRPVTFRREWRVPARSPLPAYIGWAARWLRRAGYRVVSVADLEVGEERAAKPLPAADVRLHHGELKPLELLALVRSAALVVGGSGWIIPVCVAAGTPLVVIGGGLGAHNAPDVVTDPRMDLSLARWILPDNYCMCAQMDHDCDKNISGFNEKFSTALQELVP